MPLVFGCAPVVTTFLTMFMAKTYKEVGSVFFLGLLMVVSGAVLVLLYKPASGGRATELTSAEMIQVGIWVAVTALSWGVYGPVLHKGQAAMKGSKLRPLICVGLAYFLIAVLIPLAIMPQFDEPGGFDQWEGTAWSLGGGAAGAVGALGIIMAFNFGGKPIYVMPLVFGLAPVVNTFTTIIAKKQSLAAVDPLFFVGLATVGVGAVTVLVFAPRPGKKPTAGKVEGSAARQPA
jgi:hypothetical protein